MMKKGMALLLSALLLIVTAGLALADGEADITAQGTATITASPDMVSLMANASVSGDTVAQAQEKVSQIIEQATAKLIELGVAEDEIVTSNYSFYLMYNYEATDDLGRNVITGYQANHTLKITLSDTEMLDSVLGVISDSGMGEVYDVSYGIKNRSELYQDALALAISAAEQKALKMAEAGGLTITGVESITENQTYADGYGYANVADARESATGTGSGIRAGSVSVSASVTAVYEARK
ncbi:MAG: SIMPL domain-containing protein [Clostridia bacterium]|nr:SIMPL domain-containing protein [Clostridia bacterium]